MTCILIDLADLARRAGILFLETVTEPIDDPFLVKGLQLAVDGVDPELVQQILEKQKRALVEEYERKLDVLLTGVLAISAGDNPRIVQEKCNAYFVSPS
mgnify:FL=1